MSHIGTSVRAYRHGSIIKKLKFNYNILLIMSYVGHEKKIVNIMILSNVSGGHITQFENQGFFSCHTATVAGREG